MKKFALPAFLAASFVGLASLSYLAIMISQQLEAAAKLDEAKTALIKNAHGFDHLIQYQMARDWLVVAKDYMDDYEYGRLNELFLQTADGYTWHDDPSGWGRPSYLIFAAEAMHRVRASIEKQVMHDGYAITDGIADRRMDLDHRIRRLNALSTLRHEVHLCGTEAAEATTMAEVRQIQGDLEAKKSMAAKLLKAVS